MGWSPFSSFTASRFIKDEDDWVSVRRLKLSKLAQTIRTEAESVESIDNQVILEYKIFLSVNWYGLVQITELLDRETLNRQPGGTILNLHFWSHTAQEMGKERERMNLTRSVAITCLGPKCSYHFSSCASQFLTHHHLSHFAHVVVPFGGINSTLNALEFYSTFCQ